MKKNKEKLRICLIEHLWISNTNLLSLSRFETW